MTTIVFFLEEGSAKALLEGILPRLLPNVPCRFITFSGKSDLEKQLPGKLRGWQLPDSRFVVLRDKDASDCRVIKQLLVGLCQQTGKQALVRIVCRELESWYLGDLASVGEAFMVRGAALLQEKEKFRDPDHLGNPVQLLQEVVPGYQKVAGSRRMGLVMSLQSNRSQSFKVFLAGVKKVALSTD